MQNKLQKEEEEEEDVDNAQGNLLGKWHFIESLINKKIKHVDF